MQQRARDGRALVPRATCIRDDQLALKLSYGSQPLTGRTRSVGAVEAEAAGLDLGEARVANRTAEVEREWLFVPFRTRFNQSHDRAAGKLQREVDALRQPGS